MPRIFDNMQQILLPELCKTLDSSNRADFCVGYFNLRGWKQIEERIEQFTREEGACCRLLIGMQKLPKDEIQASLSRRGKFVINYTVSPKMTGEPKITEDPLFLKVGGVDFFIDLGAEKLLAAERNGEKIAVEIKSFLNTSNVTDFHLAIGQFINYRTALKLKDPDRKLFLAIPEIAYDTFFQKEFPRLIIQEYQLQLLIYDIENEVIIKWQT